MTQPEDPPSLEDLDRRLKAAQARHRDDEDQAGGAKGRASNAGMGLGFRIAIDLVTGLAVGVGLGLLLDYWLGTSPWMMIVFFFLGSAAGMLNVYRTATGQGYAVGFQQNDTPDDDRHK